MKKKQRPKKRPQTPKGYDGRFASRKEKKSKTPLAPKSPTAYNGRSTVEKSNPVTISVPHKYHGRRPVLTKQDKHNIIVGILLLFIAVCVGVLVYLK